MIGRSEDMKGEARVGGEGEAIQHFIGEGRGDPTGYGLEGRHLLDNGGIQL